MGPIGVREALGGPRSFYATGWLVLFLPSTVLVIVQESATPFPHFGYVVASAVIQHLATGILSLPAVAFLRRGGGQLPIWWSFASWTAIGLSRGLIGGIMASALANVDPDFPLRVTVWLLASWVWMPLFTYTAAQGQNRRALLGALDDAVRRREEALRLRERSAEDIRRQLILAVQETVNGAIDDIRVSLAAARSSFDPAQLRQVGDRLASVSQQVGSVVDRLSTSTADEPQAVPSAGAPLLSALTFERRRPWLSSTLATGVLVAVLAPLCVSIKGWPFLADFGVAMLVSTLVMSLGSRMALPGLDNLRRQVAWVVARYGTAGLSGAVVLAIVHWDRFDSFTTVFILVLPYGVSFSAIIVSGAVGLAGANRQAIRSLAAIDAERADIETTAAEQENRIRDQLAAVMHGPILGRLAACAMALNFHASEVGSVPAERTEHVANAVAEHLDAATADLDSLAR